MMQFSMPWVFLLLPLPLILRWIIPHAETTGAALRVPFFQQLQQLESSQSSARNRGRLVYLVIIWLLLVVAAARPQLLGEVTDLPVTGRDMMLAVDVSGSMKAMDMEVEDRLQDRLSAVKRVAGEFIQRRLGDRIGLILFGTRAYLQAPVSLDINTIDRFLQESVIGIAGEKTAIGDAIGLALKRLNDRPGEQKLLVLLTDGTNTAGVMDPLRAAELARLGGMKIHTIGVGGVSNRGSRGLFSAPFGGRSSELDERTLTEIAEATGGRYFRATDSDSLERIYALIDQLEPVPDQESLFRPASELFFWPLSMALLMSFLWTITALLPGMSQWSREQSSARRTRSQLQSNNNGVGTVIKR